jgi:3-hydroxyacyl-CoA dehydrogenase
VPVVAAPFNMTLGGGCEFCLHADAINAYAETYMGLVEIGVGLLPAGGGTKEMSMRAIRWRSSSIPTPALHLQEFPADRHGQGVDGGGRALRHGLYAQGRLHQHGHRPPDRRRQAEGAGPGRQLYRPGPWRISRLPGRGIAASIKSQLWNMQMGNFITEYEAEMGGIIARSCAAAMSAGTLISEDYLLQLEREGFLKLCGNKKTAERIQHMLKKGKPLRN